MNSRIHPQAIAETRAAALWYDQQRAGLGAEFLAAVDVAVQRVRQSPERFARLETLPEERDVRRAIVDRFPYTVVYDCSGSDIHILAVPHSRRRPGYWMDRL